MAATLAVAAACSDAEPPSSGLGELRQALTTVDRVFGFEDVSADWALAPGSSGSLAASSDPRTEGAAAAKITGLGWAQLQSTTLVGPIGTTSNAATFDLMVVGSGSIPWGDVILQVESPTLGVNAQVGQKLLGGTMRGVFQNVSLPLSTALIEKLSSTSYGDLAIRIITNLPSGSTVIIDHLSFGQAPGGSGGAGGTGSGGSSGASGQGGGTGQGGTGGASGSGGTSGDGGASAGTGGAAGTGATGGTGGAGGGTGEELFIELASNLEPEQVIFGAYGEGGGLVINDGTKALGSAGGFANVSSVRTTLGTDLGVGTEVHDVYSTPNVFVRGSHIHGSIRTSGALAPPPQLGSIIDGAVIENTSLDPIRRLSWFAPLRPGAPPTTVEEGATLSIAPGPFAGITLAVNSRLVLSRPGVYAVDGPFIMEPGSVLQVENADSQVEIYAREFIFRGTIDKAAPRSNLLFGVLGTGDVPIDRSFDGILVAPRGSVHLGTTEDGHRTSIYARSILARPHTAVTHTPFDPEVFCEAPRCGGLCPTVTGEKRCERGEPCSTDAECADGLSCQNGFCGCAGGGACGIGDPCSEPRDCQPGLTCGIGEGDRYGVPWPDVCLPVSCTKHGPDHPDCGSISAACGVCPPCDDPDGCAPPSLLEFRPPNAENIVAGAVEGAYATSDSGSATYTIPLALPPGRADMTPDIALVYDSSGRQEILGEGWQLTGFSYITRCVAPATPAGQSDLHAQLKRRGVRGNPDDQLCLDGQQLARQPALDDASGTGYTTANDSFKRIRAYAGTGDSTEYFKVWTPEGRILTYGTPGSNDANETDRRLDGTVYIDLNARQRRVWALTRIEDQAGNYVEYKYKSKEGGEEGSGAAACATDPTRCGTTEIWPLEINYTGFGDLAPTRKVSFTYDVLAYPEPVRGYLAGILIQRTRIMNRIDVSIDGAVVKSYLMENASTEGGVRELRKIWECFPEHEDPGDDTTPIVDRCKKPTEFEYFSGLGLGPAVDSGVTLSPSAESAPEEQFVVWDADSDGHDDLVTAQQTPDGGQWVVLSVLHAQDDSLQITKTPLPYYQFQGAISRAAVTGDDPRNLYREFTQAGVLDIDGDGWDDLVDTSLRGQPDAVALKGGGATIGDIVTSSSDATHPPISFFDRAEFESQGFSPPSVTFLDVDGDGYPDVVASVTDESLEPLIQWKRSRGEGLFEDGVTLSDTVHRFFPIDMDGDGALDLVGQPLPPPVTTQGTIVNWDGSPTLPFFTLERGVDVDFVGIVPPDVTTVDMNGDGLRDVLVRELVPGPDTFTASATVDVYTNTGNGLRSPTTVHKMTHREFQAINVLDYDADGREDALVWSEFQERWILLRGLDGEFREQDLASPITRPGQFLYDRPTESGLNTNEFYSWTTVADVNGDGAQDLVVVDGQSRVWFHLGATSLSRMLKVVTDGLGEQTEIVYHSGRPGQRAYVRSLQDPLTEPEPHTKILNKVTRPLVERVLVRKLEGSEFVFDHGSSYLYSDARVDYAGRGWLGFDRRHIQNFDGDGNVTDLTFIDHADNVVLAGPPFCIDLPCEGVPGPDEEPWRYPFAGFPTRIETEYPSVASEHSVDGFRTLHKVVENEWHFFPTTEIPVTTTGRNSFSLLRSRKTTETDLSRFGSSPRPISAIEETFDHDAAGNVVFHEVWTFNHDLRVEHTVENTSYAPPDTERWLLRLPRDVSVTRTRAETGFGPDIEDFAGPPVTRAVRYTHNELGQLTVIRRQVHDLATVLTRDEFGNVTRIERSGSTGDVTRVTVVDEFDQDNIYPVHVTIQPDVADQGEFGDPPLVPHTAEYTYDPRYGEPTSVVDTNGFTESWEYDAFGRLIRHQSPNGSGETLTYADSSFDDSGVLPVPAVFKTTTMFDGGGESTEELDSFGRMVRTTSLSVSRIPDGGAVQHVRVVQELEYDASGRLHRIARPHAEGDATQGVVTHNYNAGDELTSTEHPSGMTFTFDRAEVVSLNPAERAELGLGPHDSFVVYREDFYGAVETRVFDLTGQLTLSIDAEGGRVTNTYDGFGNLRFEIGPNGITERKYDEVGRLTELLDPDRGFHEYAYTAFDEPRVHIGPGVNGSATRLAEDFRYDPFGRLKRLENADGVRRWQYDQADNGIGLISAEIVNAGGITAESNRVDYTYDSQGRVDTVTTEIQGNDYVVGLHYTNEGRVRVVDYPEIAGAPFRIERAFDHESGVMYEVRDADDPTRRFWRLEETHQGYLPHIEHIGSEVTTTRDYFENSGLPMRIQSAAGGSIIQDEHYAFNNNHNLETRRSALVADSKQTFVYDPLNRLHQVLDAANDEIERIEYDPQGTGNITFKTNVGNYTYDAPNGARPHAVTQAGNGRSFTYDDAGNQITRSGDLLGDQTLKYSLFGLPYEIAARSGATATVTSFGYNADGRRIAKQRFVQIDPDDPDSERILESFRLYVANLYEVRGTCAGGSDPDCESPARTHVYRVYGGGREVAQVHRDEGPAGEVTTQRTFFIHDDQLGSTALVTAGDDGVVGAPEPGTVLRAQQYGPFGTPSVDTSGASDLFTGFTGHQEDTDLGLVNMQGRLYDAVIGRFLSPDPINPAPDWTQGLNSYSYVLNNPLNLVDPSGFQAAPASSEPPTLGRIGPSPKSDVPHFKNEAEFAACQKNSSQCPQRPSRNRRHTGSGDAASGASGGNSQTAHPDAAQPASPDGTKVSSQPDRAATDHGTGNPGEAAEQTQANSRTKPKPRPGNTAIDEAAAAVGLLGLEAPSSLGRTGGIPGGQCEGARCSGGPLVQGAWIGIQLFGNRLGNKAKGVWEAVKAAAASVQKVAARVVDAAADRVASVVAKRGASRVANVSRPLQASDFGPNAVTNVLEGTLTVQDDVAIVAVRNIEGKLGNPAAALNALKETARQAGAKTLRIEGTIANPRLDAALRRMLGPPSRGAPGGAQDIFTIGL